MLNRRTKPSSDLAQSQGRAGSIERVESRLSPNRLVGIEGARGRRAPATTMMKDDDQASVELLRGLERQVRNRPVALAGIEELGKRGGDDPAGCVVQNQATGGQSHWLPGCLEDTVAGVDVKRQAVAVEAFIDQPLLPGGSRSGDQLVERLCARGVN